MSRKTRNQKSIRIYLDSSDKTGRLVCQEHMSRYLNRHPGALGYGETGDKCDFCNP